MTYQVNVLVEIVSQLAMPFRVKGSFVVQRHDGIRDLLTSLLSRICKNVEVELHLQPLNNEILNLRSRVQSQDWI